VSINLPIVSKFDPTGLKQAQNALGGFKKTLGTVAVALGAALSVRAVTDFAKASIGAASDLEESLNALSVSYGDASEGIAKLGEDAATRLGVTQSAFNAAAVRFSAFADRVVGEGGDVAGFVDDITTRAADFASVFNIDVAEALQVFQSGLSGEAEPLKRFGINLLQSEVQAYALEQGLISVGEQMTEDIKTQARYGLLMQETAKTQGDFANTSDGLANSQRILQANFQDMQATVGGALLPAFASLTAGLLPLVEQLGPVLGNTVESLTPAIEDLGAQIPGLLQGFIPLIPVLGQLATLFLDLIAQLLPFVVDLFSALLPILTEMVPVIISVAEDALGLFIPLLLDLTSVIAPIINNFLPIFSQLFEALAPIILQLVDALLPLIEILLPILTDLFLLLLPILGLVAQIIGVVLVAAITLFSNVLQGFNVFLDAFVDSFKAVWQSIADFFANLINGLIGAFEGFVNGAIRGINSVINAMNSIRFRIPDWIPGLGGKSFGLDLRTLNEISLPRVALAEGGIVTGPMNALIGEAGPEAVIPLNKMPKGNTYNITVNASPGTNGAAVGEQIVNLIRKYERTSGPVFARA